MYMHAPVPFASGMLSRALVIGALSGRMSVCASHTGFSHDLDVDIAWPSGPGIVTYARTGDILQFSATGESGSDTTKVYNVASLADGCSSGVSSRTDLGNPGDFSWEVPDSAAGDLYFFCSDGADDSSLTVKVIDNCPSTENNVQNNPTVAQACRCETWCNPDWNCAVTWSDFPVCQPGNYCWDGECVEPRCNAVEDGTTLPNEPSNDNPCSSLDQMWLRMVENANLVSCSGPDGSLQSKCDYTSCCQINTADYTTGMKCQAVDLLIWRELMETESILGYDPLNPAASPLVDATDNCQLCLGNAGRTDDGAPTAAATGCRPQAVAGTCSTHAENDCALAVEALSAFGGSAGLQAALVTTGLSTQEVSSMVASGCLSCLYSVSQDERSMANCTEPVAPEGGGDNDDGDDTVCYSSCEALPSSCDEWLAGISTGGCAASCTPTEIGCNDDGMCPLSDGVTQCTYPEEEQENDISLEEGSTQATSGTATIRDGFPFAACVIVVITAAFGAI
jgi:hypothetical protein